VKPAPFRYRKPASVEEALSILAEEGFDAKPLAGGQSLIPTMNFRLAQPAVLVDLSALDELRGIEPLNGGLRIGAMTRQVRVERSDLIRERAPLIHEIMPWIAHIQIRNRGTIGGSVAHADPSAELPAAMLALDATYTVRGLDGVRTVAARDFHTGLFATALEPGELLTAIEIPGTPDRTGFAFEEAARRHGDFALVGVCAAVTLNAARECASATITLLSVGDGPILAATAGLTLAGRLPTDDALREAAEAAATADIDPPADIHASSDYRRHLTRVLTARALRRAVRAVGPDGQTPE
jgi:CO/xanthine dehydrogenase FAD-binding subunit